VLDEGVERGVERGMLFVGAIVAGGLLSDPALAGEGSPEIASLNQRMASTALNLYAVRMGAPSSSSRPRRSGIALGSSHAGSLRPATPQLSRSYSAWGSQPGWPSC
jgi:hypothetical protein